MKKVVCLIMVAIMLMTPMTVNAESEMINSCESMPSISFAEKQDVYLCENDPILIELNHGFVSKDQKSLEEAIQDRGVYVYEYWEYLTIHSWKGSYIDLGVGMFADKPYLSSFTGTVEIYSMEGLLPELIRTQDVNLKAGAGTTFLGTDVTMFTGKNVKRIRINVKNAYFTDIYGKKLSLKVSGKNFSRP